jgi:predicted  nucleic acid-binding Zn-ribbon protein
VEKENEILQFAVLEDRLNKILEGYTTLKEEREKLISQMHVNEEEVEKLREEIATLKNERSEVRTRIERLIERLEGIPLDQ